MLHVVLLAGWLIVAQGNPIVPSPPVTTQTHVDVTVSAPSPDPQVVADTFTQGSESVLITVIVPPPVSIANDFLGLPNIWTQTPDEWSWNNPALRQLADAMRIAALALMGIAIFAAGLRHALNAGTNYGRLALGLLMSAGNLVWWQWGVQMNNALCTSLAGGDLVSIMRPHLQVLTQPNPGALTPEQIVTLVMMLIAAVVTILVGFALVMRLALLDVLLVVGPLLLITAATEDSNFIAQHYMKLSVAVLFSQVAIVVGFRVAGVLAGLGNGSVVSTLLAIAVLFVVKDLPKTLIAGYATAGSSGTGSAGWMLLMARRLVMRG